MRWMEEILVMFLVFILILVIIVGLGGNDDE